LEGGLESLDLDAKVAQQAFGDVAVILLGRVDRLAAAVTDEQATVDGELVAFGVTAEIIVIVEHQNARRRPRRATIEPSGRPHADPAADTDEVVAFLERQSIEREPRARTRLRVRGLERAWVLAAQAGQRRGIALRRGRDLRRRREAGSNGQGHSVEEVAARN